MVYNNWLTYIITINTPTSSNFIKDLKIEKLKIKTYKLKVIPLKNSKTLKILRKFKKIRKKGDKIKFRNKSF